MTRSDFQVTEHQADAPKPTPPEFYAPLWKWEHYWNDLACWMATQADRRTFGIREKTA